MAFFAHAKLLYKLNKSIPTLIDEVNNIAVLQSYIKRLQTKSAGCRETSIDGISVRDKSQYLVSRLNQKIKELQQNTINDSFLEKYICEVQTLRIKTILDPITNMKYWDLSEYNQHTNKYKLFLEDSQYKTRQELSDFTIEEFRVLIARLEVIQQRFNKLFKLINSKKYLENAQDCDVLPLMISNFITIVNHEVGVVTISFTHDLMNAIKLKNSSIISLIERAKSVLRHHSSYNNQIRNSNSGSFESIYLFPLTDVPAYIGDNRSKTLNSLEDILIFTKNNLPELKRSIQEWYERHEFKDLFISYTRIFVNDKIIEAGDLLVENDKAQYEILNSFIDANDRSIINKKVVQNSARIKSLISKFNNYFSFFDDPEPEYIIDDDNSNIIVVTKYQPIKNNSDFNNVFEREFKIIKEKNSFITKSVFCELEIQKIQNWISEFDESLSNSGRELHDFLLSDHYLRAKTYLEFLSLLKLSFSNNQEADHDFIMRTFPQHIEHTDQIFIAEKIKTNFSGKKGKAIRLMIEVLTSKGLLNIIDGEYSMFHRAMKEYFDWEIGSYNSIFQTYEYKPENAKCKKDFNAISVIIDGILNSTKKNINISKLIIP